MLNLIYSCNNNIGLVGGWLNNLGLISRRMDATVVFIVERVSRLVGVKIRKIQGVVHKRNGRCKGG